MSNSSSSNSGGIGFLSLLAIIFITLKLTGVITWSWWLVLLPLYGGFALVLAVIFGALALAAIIALISSIFNK